MSRHLADRVRLNDSLRPPTGWLEIRGASTNNLAGVDVDIPRGVLTVVTGVAGSGKSSLVHGHLSPMKSVVTIDQSPIKRSRRSNPATCTGILEPIRKAFAKANKAVGAKPAHFSANSEGACPVCGGTGVIETQLGFMETVESHCEARGAIVLDEPTAGLHPADVEALLALLEQDGPWWSSSTIRLSWRTPTGLSTWAPGPGTTADASSSPARRPSW